MLGAAMDSNKTTDCGVPLHACNGFRHDEHYWARVGHRNSDPINAEYNRKEREYCDQFRALPKHERVSLTEWLRCKIPLPDGHPYLKGHVIPTNPPQPIY